MLKGLIFILGFVSSNLVVGQILPSSPLAYKTMMKAKKTNMCYIIKSKVENGQIQDTLIFNFKDFIYELSSTHNQVVTLELTKILKNYADCKGKGGLRLDFKLQDKKLKSDSYCVDRKREVGADGVYTCFVVEEKSKVAKGKATKAPKKTCYDIGFFKKKESYLDTVTQISRKDIKFTSEKTVCI